MGDLTGGRVSRVNGPLVEIRGLDGLSVSEVVELGTDRLPAETVALDGEVVTAQAYEYTGGLRVGDAARRTGRPLSAQLGPGLLGRVFDGLLRPLSEAPVWLAGRPLDTVPAETEWDFLPDPARVPGEEVGPGTVLGTVKVAGPVDHRVLVPPGAGGRLENRAAAGRIGAAQPVAVVGGRPIGLYETWPVRRPRPVARRLESDRPLHTGQRVIDLLYPVVRGSVAAVPGGFGTGKTMLLQQLGKWSDADVIVYIGCGERGNEMADVLGELAELPDPRTGGRLLDRTVIIANTSNMPMMARETSIYAGMTVAEYFRDLGQHVVVIADSTSRWAEALREFASRTAALPAEEGYPAQLGSALAAFYGRAGAAETLGGEAGSVTVIGAVSPPGGDLAEPVTTMTLRFVQTLWSLDRDLAYSHHYPAVSWSGSFSRDVPAVAGWFAANGDPGWAARRARAVALLAEADRLAALGDLLGRQALPGRERMTLLAGRLLREGVLSQNALSANDGYCSAAKGAALIDLVSDVAAAAGRVVDRGVPAAAVEELDLSGVLRAREEAGPDDAAAVRARARESVDRLEALR